MTETNIEGPLYAPRKKVIIIHQDRFAEYFFDKKKATSSEEGFLSADGLSIPELKMKIVELGDPETWDNKTILVIDNLTPLAKAGMART